MTKSKIAKKHIKLSHEFDSYSMRHDALMDKVPIGAWLIITDDKDPEFSKETRSWVKRIPRTKKVVEAYKTGHAWKIRPLVVSE